MSYDKENSTSTMTLGAGHERPSVPEAIHAHSALDTSCVVALVAFILTRKYIQTGYTFWLV